MEKLERVRRLTYRRMDQVVSELERFEERPELDTRKRYGSLLKRFEELEKLYYNLRPRQATDPYQLIKRILAEHSTRVMMQSPVIRRGAPTFRVTGGDLVEREDNSIFPLYGV
jgi:hypothetical protein